VNEWIGRYRILRPLGEGGMGKLFVGEAAGASGFARRVVVKVVRDELDDDLKHALLDEARLTSSLVHRNIVPVLDLEESGEKRLVILEYVDGMDLRHVLERVKKLPWQLAVFAAMEVAAGLDYAHRHVDKGGRPLQIVHRDVSPANILLSWEGEVKLTDFGVAKFRRHDGSGAGLKGNLAYMAPEQAKGEEVDVRADVFALGVVLYEAIAGKNPFQSRQDLATLAHVRDGQVPLLPREAAPQVVAEIVARATARDKSARYATAAELREALVNLPGMPKDPARQLAAFLQQQVRPKQGVAPDALLEAVLGGGRPVTQAAGAKPAAAEATTPAEAATPPRWLMALAIALCVAAFVAVGLRYGVQRHEVAPLIAPLAAPVAAPPKVAKLPAETAASKPPVVVPPPEPTGTCQLEVKSHPSGARLIVDGKPFGPTPITLSLDCRSLPYRLALTLRGHAQWQKELAIAEPTVQVAATLLPRGSLSVNAIPWANLFIDGKPMGHTPRLGLPMDPGKHTLKLVTKKGDTRTRTVDVPPGKPTKLTVVFSEP
jgi:hypothetical protein